MTKESDERIAELEQELARACSDRDDERNRNKRLKASLYWRLTLPLRALRRAFIDPFTREGIAIEEAESNPPENLDAELESTVKVGNDSAENQESVGPPPAYRDYSDFCRRMQPLVDEYCSSFAQRIDRLESNPLISIILPVFNAEPKWLQGAIESVKSQVYPNWELCIADDASTRSDVQSLLREYEVSNPKIKVIYRDRNGHISAASNSALGLATGEFIALLDHDDVLPSHALARIVDRIQQHPDAAIIYSDEDKIDEAGLRSQPHFKSDWNPDLLLGQNCISHLGVYRKSYVDRIGGFREGYEGAQDWDLVLRVSELCEPSQIQHIPEVLYHWRSIEGSTAKDIDEKDYAHEAAGKALEDRFQRLNIDASLEPVDRFYWRPIYKLPDPVPEIAIVIPTRDRLDLLEGCVKSVRENTDYPNYRIVIANNESKEPAAIDYLDRVKQEGIDVIDTPGSFNFSRINNTAIRSRSESLICLLNNDTTIIDPGWLREMAMHASREEIGVVGARLLFPHDHVQHAGIVLGIGGIGSEAFKYIHKTDDGYIHRAFLIGNYSAVTGACMLFRRSIWETLGGLDEKNTPNAFSDIDFCLKAESLEFRTLYTPFARLYHHQSASRGVDDSDEFRVATAYMREQWGERINDDPYYNPNLTLEREDFTLTFPPRGYSSE